MTTGGTKIENWQRAGFGLYVHWPFCESKCPYCDFNSHVADHVDHEIWRDALVSEIARLGQIAPERQLSTVFFGGGTPSLMPPGLVEDIIEAAKRQWRPRNSLEVTLEANPSSVEADRFRAYRDAGVNRISMGFQALNDQDLKLLGRRHTAEEGRRAFDTARNLFDRVSFDLIYARQNQSIKDWEAELRQALAMAVDHLSLYQLTIEENTAFAARLRNGGLQGLPDEDASADLFEATQSICSSAGMPAYEVSNHARPGAEARHNLIYWHGGDYAAIGPGAHGRLTVKGQRLATEAYRLPTEWLEAVKTQRSGDKVTEALSRSEQAIEYALNSMRLTEGMEISHLSVLLNREPSELEFRDLEDIGMVVRRQDRLITTPAGRLVLNAVLAQICSRLPEPKESTRPE